MDGISQGSPSNVDWLAWRLGNGASRVQSHTNAIILTEWSRRSRFCTYGPHSILLSRLQSPPSVLCPPAAITGLQRIVTYRGPPPRLAYYSALLPDYTPGLAVG